MTGTVTIIIDDLEVQRTLRDTDDRQWLTRSTLTRDRNAPLHRSRDDALCVRQAAGRWQLHYAKASPTNLVRVIRHDDQPVDATNRSAVMNRLLHPAADVFGRGPDRLCEFDLHDGSWMIGVRATNGVWYLARLWVDGQLVQLRGSPATPEGDPTWDQGTSSHASTAARSTWPPPEHPDHLFRTRRWLDGHGAWSAPVSRRWVFGYLYKEYLLEETVAPAEQSAGDVTTALDLNEDTFNYWRSHLRKVIWGTKPSTTDHLRCYLLEQGLLSAQDALDAVSYADALKATRGEQDHVDVVAKYRATQRAKNAADDATPVKQDPDVGPEGGRGGDTHEEPPRIDT